MIIDLTSRLSTISEYYGRCKLKAVLRHAYTAIICVLVLQFIFMCVSNQSGNDEFEHFERAVQMQFHWLNILISVWVRVKIFIFDIFHVKKLKNRKKSKKFRAKYCKKMGFLSLHQNAGQVFYSQKTTFSHKKAVMYKYFG